MVQVSKLLNCGQNQQMIVPEFLHADLCLQFTESWGSFSDKNWYSEIHVPIETELAEFGLWVVQVSLVRISLSLYAWHFLQSVSGLPKSCL